LRPLIAWFVPDLALATATITLFYCLFFFQGYQKLFRDSDAGWHIRTGEAILASGHLPRTDPYSFSREGEPWFAWEWGSDVLVGAIDRAAGLRGVALFYGGVIAAGVWLWFRLHWDLGGDFLLACAMAPLLLSTCEIHWLARPHVIGWLFVLALFRGQATQLPNCKVSRQFGSCVACPQNSVEIAVFMIIWANMHASFFLGPVILAVHAAGLRKAELLWPTAIATIAPLANPYGWHLYAHVFRYLADSELLSRISEFQSFDFHSAGAGQIIAALILAIAGGTLSLVRRRYEHFLLALVFSVLALRSARMLPIAALLLLPVANGAITATFHFPWRDYAKRLRELDSLWKGYGLVPIAMGAAFSLLRIVPAGFSPEDFPVAAYPHVAEDARLFAPDKFGGYLIYRSNGTRKVFFDGRSDFYGPDFLKRYSRMVQLRPGWRDIWDSFHFTQALMPNDFPLVWALEQIGWRPLYQDGTAILLTPPAT